MQMELNIQLPKNASSILSERADKAVEQLRAGTARIRKSERYGYRTLALGRCERAVIIQNTLYVFSKHRDYEKFINKAM